MKTIYKAKTENQITFYIGSTRLSIKDYYTKHQYNFKHKNYGNPKIFGSTCKNSKKLTLKSIWKYKKQQKTNTV